MVSGQSDLVVYVCVDQARISITNRQRDSRRRRRVRVSRSKCRRSCQQYDKQRPDPRSR